MKLVWSTFFIIVLVLCHHAAEGTECTARGRFPNNLRNDCRGYTMCLNVNTNFTRIDLICPDSSIYSHLDSQCTNVTSYQCLPDYNCTGIGDLPNPYLNDCGSYVSCFDSLGTIVTARLVQCPPDTLFNPSNSTCVSSTLYKCETPTSAPIVFNASVSDSPGLDDVLPKSNACYMNCYTVTFFLFVSFVIMQ